MATDYLLEARGLGLAVGGRRLCSGLNLGVREGECWAILGPNGSGKTTLLHALGGLRPTDEGSVQWRGMAMSRIAPRRRAREIGLMLQNEDVAFPVSVLERVLAARHPHLPLLAWETAADLQLAREALALAELGHCERRITSTLSGGERRRLQLAALLCQAPRLALLDEPENDLDLRHQSRLIAHVVERFTRPGHAAVMVLHDVNLACRLCTHLVLLGEGEASAGPVDELATVERLSALYQCELTRIAGPQGGFLVTAG